MIQVGGIRQLLIWHTESINSLDPATGGLFWSVPLDPNWGMSIATPRQWGKYLFVGGIVNKSVMLELDAEQPGAEVIWKGGKYRGIGPVFSPPFLEDGHMYGIDRYGELRCVKIESGEHVWTTYAATTGETRANSAAAFLVKREDGFFILNDSGELISAHLSPAGYREISRARILQPTSDGFGRTVVWSHPAFASRCMFARNDRQMVCVSLADDP
jgi:hypothetical protein